MVASWPFSEIEKAAWLNCTTGKELFSTRVSSPEAGVPSKAFSGVKPNAC